MVNIKVVNLGVDLRGRKVLNGIAASLRAGELVGIIGPNGAGKSTLVRAMLGLVPASRGGIAVGDRDIRTIPARQMARTISYLPQGQTLHWPLSVERLVTLGRLPGLGPMSRPSAEDMRVVHAAMARADVGMLAQRTATRLSGGERARVMLARALAVEAPALIADEPLASLDPGHQIDVMELLRGEARAGSLIVSVLHDLTMAARYCDRLLLIDRGALVADGAPVDVLTPQRLRDVYGITGKVDFAADAPLVVPLERV